MFRARVLIISRTKLHYTTSGIITPIGGRLMYAGAYAPAYQTVIYTEYTRRPPIGVMIPEAV